MKGRKTFDIEKKISAKVGRRDFLRNSSAALAAPFIASLLPDRAAAQARSVSFASYGGSFNDAFVAAYAEKFQAETGVTVNMGSGASLALAQLQVATPGGAQWDIVELTGPEYEIAVKQDLLLPYDYNVIDASNIPDQFKKSHGIRYAIFLCLMAWDQRKIPDAEAPKDWAEFWDTKRFPGRRSLYANIGDGGTLEFALLADGVTLDELYPLDVDRALASLDKLGKENIIWHTTNAEPVQQLVDGQVTLATSWLGRATRAINSGAQIGLNPRYGGMTGDYMAMVKTTKKPKEATELINFVVSDVEASVKFVEVSNNAVPNSAVLPRLPEKLVNNLPTSPTIADTVWLKSDAWWSENLEATLIKFKQWQLS